MQAVAELEKKAGGAKEHKKLEQWKKKIEYADLRQIYIDIGHTGCKIHMGRHHILIYIY
jgi:hypothetical protein